MSRPTGRRSTSAAAAGSGSIELARRGWQVTGIDIVPKAVRRARERARQAGVEVQFVDGDVAALRAAGVGSGFRLVLDFGAVHGLTERQRECVGKEVSAVTLPGATLVMYATSPGRRGPLPRGTSREEVEAAYPDWTVIDEAAFDVSGGCPLKNAAPRWYRLRRE